MWEMIMANPRRNSYTNNQGSEAPMVQNLSHSHSVSSLFIQFLKKPHAFPFLLSLFLLLTWLSLRVQHASYFSPSFPSVLDNKSSKEDDILANLVRFSSGFPSQLANDKRGWLVDPISLALRSGISGTFTLRRTRTDILIWLSLGLLLLQFFSGFWNFDWNSEFL